jgi:hypothetical protein
VAVAFHSSVLWKQSDWKEVTHIVGSVASLFPVTFPSDELNR